MKKDADLLDLFWKDSEPLMSPSEVEDKLPGISSIMKTLVSKRLEQLPKEDLEIRHEELTIRSWHKVFDEVASAFKMALLTPVVSCRGEAAEAVHFVEKKAVDNGFINLEVVSSLDNDKTRIWVQTLDGQNNREEEFICTVEDLDTGEIYLDHENVRLGYLNRTVGPGRYRISIKSSNVEGSIELKLA
jgi:hypothetical protein